MLGTLQLFRKFDTFFETNRVRAVKTLLSLLRFTPKLKWCEALNRAASTTNFLARNRFRILFPKNIKGSLHQ